jgi:hypothetical protein
MCYFQYAPVKAVHEIGKDDKPIIAYKVLRVQRPFNYYDQKPSPQLQSPTQGTIWSKGKLFSRVPGKNSEVGIYAFVTRHAAASYRNGRQQRVVAELELSGRVVEHHSSAYNAAGYRAQRATIKRVWVNSSLQEVVSDFRREFPDIIVNGKRGRDLATANR